MIGVICPGLIQSMQRQVVQVHQPLLTPGLHKLGKPHIMQSWAGVSCWNQGYLLWDGAPWLQLFLLCTSTPGSFVSLSWDIPPGTSMEGTFTTLMDHRGPKSCSTWGSQHSTNNVPVIHTLRCSTATYLIRAGLSQPT